MLSTTEHYDEVHWRLFKSSHSTFCAIKQMPSSIPLSQNIKLEMLPVDLFPIWASQLIMIIKVQLSNTPKTPMRKRYMSPFPPMTTIPFSLTGNRDVLVSPGSYFFLSNSCGQGEEWLKSLNKGVWIPFTGNRIHLDIDISLENPAGGSLNA